MSSFFKQEQNIQELQNLSVPNLSCFPVFFESLCLLDSSTCRGEGGDEPKKRRGGVEERKPHY